jgi:transcriptional regulator with XRE-family HTH domain
VLSTLTDEDHSMETAGQRLKRRRERLGLRFREVEEASQQIARRKNNPEYAIALSRLADIENKGTVPSIFRLYALCSIYRIDLREVMRWYGVDADELPAEAAELPLEATHAAGFLDVLPKPVAPNGNDDAADPSQTSFLRHVHRWGKLSSGLLAGFDSQHHRYGYIGSEDRSMYPLLEPGSLILIDIRHRKIAVDGWTSERDRPIYFLEHRDGYRCGWCSMVKDNLVVQPHPASSMPPEIFHYPEEIEVIGEVVGTAMLFTSRVRRESRGIAIPARSPSR